MSESPKPIEAVCDPTDLERIEAAAEGHGEFGTLIFSTDVLFELAKDFKLDGIEEGMDDQVEFNRPHRLTYIANLRSELLSAVDGIGEGGCNCSSCETWRSDFRTVIERVLPAEVKR